MLNAQRVTSGLTKITVSIATILGLDGVCSTLSSFVSESSDQLCVHSLQYPSTFHTTPTDKHDEVVEPQPASESHGELRLSVLRFRSLSNCSGHFDFVLCYRTSITCLLLDIPPPFDIVSRDIWDTSSMPDVLRGQAPLERFV